MIGTTSGTAADGGTASAHYSNTSNPHSVTKSQVGLGNVVNTGDSATPVSGGTTKFTTGGAYTELNKKVDKVTGKGLSTNDYTTEEKNKLAGIAAGAEVNVQSDWNATSGDAFIKNKPTTISGYGISDAYTKSETYTKTEVNGLVDTPHQDYVTVATYASLPASGSKDTIYRVSNYNGSTSQVDASVYSEYAWNGSQYVFLCVKSQIGEVFDISVYNNNAKYADLAAALNGGANIPQSLQKGGMSVKYVQSSDNKYVQFRLMNSEWSTTITDWQGVDDEPTSGSDNLVKSGGVYEKTNLINGDIIPTEIVELTKVGDTSLIASNYHNTYYTKVAKGFAYILSFNSDGVHSDLIQYGFCTQKPERGVTISNYHSYDATDGSNMITITASDNLYFVFSHTSTSYLSNINLTIVSLKTDIESLKDTVEELDENMNLLLPETYTVSTFIKRYLDNGVVKASNYYRLCYINVEKGKTYILKVSRETALRESKIGFFSTTPATDVEYTDEFVSGFNENENLVIYEATKDGILAWSFYETDVTVVDITVIPNHYMNSNSSVYALKETSSIIVYVRRNNYQYFGYVFSHRLKSFEENQYPSFFDNWGISNVTFNYFYNGKMYLCSELFTNGSEAELAFTTQDGNGGISYIGGSAHGFENITSIDNVRQIRLTKDCNPINESDTFDLIAISEFKCCQDSNIYRAYTNSGIIANAHKNWTINKNGLEFSVKLSAITDFDIGSGAQMGMLGVFRRFKGSTSYSYLTKYAIKENLPKVFNVEDGWDNTELGRIDNNCYQLSEGGDYGLNFSMLILETNRDISGGMFVTTNNSSYNKMYNQFVKQKSMVEGQEYHAKIQWIIS